MSSCTEFAVFEVAKGNLERVVQLSESLFLEINADKKVIIFHEILRKTDNAEELCWHLIWSSPEAVKSVSKKWASYPSSSELESLVGKKRYYGHFVSIKK
ncbi:hypothetical protein [Psychromonas sp.]|uniref:hypothetical protein n=1 Tax=Psychromonas sp. TaxID=1884585 RepID=UPI003568EBDB